MIVDIYAQVIASPYLAGIEQALGAEFLDKQSAPPRMVWVPVGDSFVSGTNEKRNTSNKTMRAVATRNASVRIRVWSKAQADTAEADIAAIETTVRKLICAIHDAAVGDFELQGGAWVAEEGSEVLQYGRAYDLTVTFQIPIYRDPEIDGITTVGPLLTQSNDDLAKDFGPLGND